MRGSGVHLGVARAIGAVLDAAARSPDQRLPEALSGHGRSESSRPILYPDANSPQAWSSSAVIQLVQLMLGIYPFAPLKLLALVRPRLPEWLPAVTIRGVRVGGSSVDLEFTRRDDGSAGHRVVRRRGPLLVVDAPPPQTIDDDHSKSDDSDEAHAETLHLIADDGSANDDVGKIVGPARLRVVFGCPKPLRGAAKLRYYFEDIGQGFLFVQDGATSGRSVKDLVETYTKLGPGGLILSSRDEGEIAGFSRESGDGWHLYRSLVTPRMLPSLRRYHNLLALMLAQENGELSDTQVVEIIAQWENFVSPVPAEAG